jgi:colicin import membrane protein
MSPHGLARLLLLAAAWTAGAALAAEALDAAAERERIRLERAAVEARYKQGELACRERFAVTGCVTDLQTQRREALAPLRQREIELDEAKRKADAEENARRLEAKRAAAQSKPVPEPRVESAPGASAARSAASAVSSPSARALRRSQTADDAAAAAARATAQQRRLSEAAAHRQAVEQRNAERAARGKKSTPLPVPAALPPASAASR